MALETQTISTAEIKPIFAFDTDAQALGTAHEAADDFYTLPVVSYTLPYNSATLEMAPNRVGVYGQIESQGRHRQDLSTYTFDVSFLGTTTAIRANCLWAFGDAATPMALTPAIGIGNGVTGDMQMKHGATSANHTTAVFINGGTDAAAEDLIVKGAMVQSMTLRQDIGANAGQMTIDSTFFSAYGPHEAADDLTSDTTDTGTPKSIFELNTNSQAGCLQLGGQELQPMSWEITISRTLERVGSQDYSSYLPFAVAQTGAWEVTGSMVVKADDNTYDLITQLKGDSSGINLSIDGADGFTIDLPDVMVDAASLDNGGTHLTHTIPFRAMAADSTSNIISITV
jgi:hypothetical protein